MKKEITKQEREVFKMTDQEILKHIDHTQLKQFATWEDIEKLAK